jgi:hypothetical protein
MDSYIGTKVVFARPMTRECAEKHLGRAIRLDCHIPDNEDNGYLVLYENGYQSWIPLDVFEKVYRKTDGMSFGLAIEAAKIGRKVARKGWNGKDMWVSVSPGCDSLPASGFWHPAAASFAESNGGFAIVPPCFIMKTADGKIQMGWLASRSDMLADDWYIVE